MGVKVTGAAAAAEAEEEEGSRLAAQWEQPQNTRDKKDEQRFRSSEPLIHLLENQIVTNGLGRRKKTIEHQMLVS